MLKLLQNSNFDVMKYSFSGFEYNSSINNKLLLGIICVNQFLHVSRWFNKIHQLETNIPGTHFNTRICLGIFSIKVVFFLLIIVIYSNL